MRRTHTCGGLTKEDVGKAVRLCGWVKRVRNLGGVTFVQIRDRYGLTQVVHNPGTLELDQKVDCLGKEDCLEVSGLVRARAEKDVNPEMATGLIEVVLCDLTVLNSSKEIPFEIDDREAVKEETRFKYRFLDLRRPRMVKNLITRHEVIQVVRDSLDRQGFLEMHTPLFVRSTPEGARDYLVPCRNFPGHFYALPQSPQLYKQILMISGFDRYFQFAHCFRDEDLRADRAPVHTQIDLEMSFVEETDVQAVVEDFIRAIFQKLKGVDIAAPFQKMTYPEAMSRFGSDKPDLRNPLELQLIDDLVAGLDFEVFRQNLCNRGSVVALKVPGAAEKISRKSIDGYTELVKRYRLHGLGWLKYSQSGFKGGLAKFFEGEAATRLVEKLVLQEGDMVFIGAAATTTVYPAMGHLRNAIAKELGLIDLTQIRFLWVNEFPLFEQDPDSAKWIPMHHIFTMPLEECIDHLESNPGSVRGHLYDLVFNGVELLSGSIRIHKPELQKRVMALVDIDEAAAEQKFGFLLNALNYGAPPHGGAAVGLDRLVAVLCGEESIKEVIAFPHNSHGQFLLDGSPTKVEADQLKELHLDVRLSSN